MSVSVRTPPPTEGVIVPRQLAQRPSRAPVRAFRVPDDIWDAAKDRADADNVYLSTVIRDVLERYTKRPDDVTRPTVRPDKGENVAVTRTQRIADALWNPAMVKAAARGESLADVICVSLARYADTG